MGLSSKEILMLRKKSLWLSLILKASQLKAFEIWCLMILWVSFVLRLVRINESAEKWWYLRKKKICLWWYLYYAVMLGRVTDRKFSFLWHCLSAFTFCAAKCYVFDRDHAGGNDKIRLLVPGIKIYGGSIDNVKGCTHKLENGDKLSLGTNISILSLHTPWYVHNSLLASVSCFKYYLWCYLSFPSDWDSL